VFGVTCSLETHADLAELARRDVVAILKTLQWLSRIP